MAVNFFFSSRRRHTRCLSDWSSDVCSSDLADSRLLTRARAMLRPGWGSRLACIAVAPAALIAAAAVGAAAALVRTARGAPKRALHRRELLLHLVRSEEHTSELQSLRHLVCR